MYDYDCNYDCKFTENLAKLIIDNIKRTSSSDSALKDDNILASNIYGGNIL